MLCHSGSLEPYQASEPLTFKLTDQKDKIHSLFDYRGKVVLVNFWASWCPPCIHEMPALKKLKQHHAGKPFEVLALNVGEKKYKIRKFAKIIKLDLPVLLDTTSKTFNEWNVKTLPTSFLIDATGAVRYRVIGNPGWDNTETMGIIDKLLTETLKTTEKNQ
jgi:thiol-disulfide isomerase/thioredoxin